MKTPHPGAQRLRRGQGIGEARRGVGQVLDLAAIDRLHDRVARREVAIKRADPDIGATRDLFEARLRPHFRERRLGRLK